MSASRFRLFLSGPAVGKLADESRERVVVWQLVKMESYHE
jgi:hypothetical protein